MFEVDLRACGQSPRSTQQPISCPPTQPVGSEPREVLSQRVHERRDHGRQRRRVLDHDAVATDIDAHARRGLLKTRRSLFATAVNVGHGC